MSRYLGIKSIHSSAGGPSVESFIVGCVNPRKHYFEFDISVSVELLSEICVFKELQVRLHLNVKLFNRIRMSGFVVRLFCI